MKNTLHTSRWLPAAIAALGLVAAANNAGAAADVVVSTFDTDISTASDGGSWPGSTKTLDWAAVDADNSPSSGSLYLTVAWDPAVSGWQDSKVGFADPGKGDFAWPGIDCTLFVNLEFDVRIDTTNSLPANDGSYGGAQVIFQGWEGANGNPANLGWVQVGSVNFAATSAWQHFKVPLSAYPHNVNKLVLSFFVSPGTNSISYFVDNLKFTAPPSPPPTISLASAPSPGLTFVASREGDTYQRQIIRTASGTYSWNTAWAQGATTSYSFTITNFPNANYAGFLAQMFLVPDFAITNKNTMQYGATDSSIDWNSANVIYFTVAGNADGSATADWRYKTNEWGGQQMSLNDQDGGQYGTNGWAQGHLAILQCARGPVGTWTVAFNQNTNVSITAPDGSQTNFVLAASVADMFPDPLYAYFGVQPNSNARIGQSATFSKLKITGSAASIDDTFVANGPPYALDTATWTKSAADGAGIFVTPPGAKFWLSWTTPDAGFSTAYVTDDLTKSLGNSEWLDLKAAPASWITVGSKHMAVIDQAMLDAALAPLGYTPTNLFFGLWKVVNP